MSGVAILTLLKDRKKNTFNTRTRRENHQGNRFSQYGTHKKRDTPEWGKHLQGCGPRSRGEASGSTLATAYLPMPSTAGVSISFSSERENLKVATGKYNKFLPGNTRGSKDGLLNPKHFSSSALLAANNS